MTKEISKEQKNYRIAITIGVLAAICIVFFPSYGNAKSGNNNNGNGHERQQQLCNSLPASALNKSNVYRTLCSDVADPSPSTSPDPSPDPEPSIDHVLITEVYYDVATAYGEETTNEWIELYNGTGSSIDLSNWIISDAGTQRLLPASTIIQNGQYAVVTKDATTLDYWSIPSNALVVVLGSAIGNGLGNDGDVLYIKDSVGNEIDTVSWGSNTSAF